MTTHVRRHIHLRQVVAGAVAVAIAGAAVVVGGVANAQTPPVGTWTPDQLTGSDLAAIKGTTNGTCDVPGTAEAPADGYNGTLIGPGPFGRNLEAGRPEGPTIVSTTDVGFSTTDPLQFVFRTNFRNLAQELGTLLLPGDYVVTIRCVNQFDLVVYQRFEATLTFAETDPNNPGADTYTVTNPAPGTPTPTPEPGEVTATSTTLNVFPNPAFRGLPVVLLARVSSFAAEGTVQFRDGTTNVGEPVPVFGGFALLFTSELDRGSHSLTAEFTPADSADFGPSTSDAEELTVRSLFDFLVGVF